MKIPFSGSISIILALLLFSTLGVYGDASAAGFMPGTLSGSAFPADIAPAVTEVGGANLPSSRLPAFRDAPGSLGAASPAGIPGIQVIPGSSLAAEWISCIGGSGYEEGWAIVPGPDDGIILAGYTESPDGDFAAAGGHGGGDAFLAGVNATGAVLWATCIGGSGYEGSGYSGGLDMDAASGGGTIVTGFTESGDGDFAEAGYRGGGDAFLARVDATGTVLWTTCIGGSGQDQGFSIRETTDGGYILAGRTNSSDGDLGGAGYHAGYDSFVAKVNATGGIQWIQCIGGSDTDDSWAVDQAADGTFILSGYTYSADGTFTGAGYHGGGDAFAAGISSTGTVLWVRLIGGSGPDLAFSAGQTGDGGYVLSGRTGSSDGDFAAAGYHGDGTSEDAFLAKLSPSGVVLWSTCVGGSGPDGAVSAVEAENGRLVLAGWTASEDGDLFDAGYHGGYDAFVAGVGPQGSAVRAVCAGGSGQDFAYAIQAGAGGRFILAGQTDSTDGDLSGASSLGGGDAFTGGFLLPAEFGIGVFRPAAYSNWILDRLSDGSVDIRDHFGSGTDRPMVGDFNNDGMPDRMLFRNGEWIIDHGMDGSVDQRSFYGQGGDLPLTGFFDADRTCDRAVFRSGEWIVDLLMDGSVNSRSSYGTTGDIPLIGDFNGDGTCDRAVFRGAAPENWIIDYGMDGSVNTRNRYGQAGDIPLTGDFNDDGICDRAVFRNGDWIIDYRMDGTVDIRMRFGQAGDVPLMWIL